MNPQLTFRLADDAAQVVAVCSILHSALPPEDIFSDYPRIQKAYSLFVALVGFVAANWRGESLKIHGGTGTATPTPEPSTPSAGAPATNGK